MKEHQVAAVYNNENPELLGMSSMMGDMRMGSLVDNIILMNWVEPGDTFRLGLTVAKMRANPCVRTTRECEVINGLGMRVLDRELKLPPVPFSRYSSLLSRAPDRRERERANPSDGIARSADGPSLTTPCSMAKVGAGTREMSAPSRT